MVEVVGSEAQQKVLDRLVAAAAPRTRRPAIAHRPRLLMIAGATAVGKSTLSAVAGVRLGFARVVSTDTVREILRSARVAAEAPALHRSSFSDGSGVSAVEDWLETCEAVGGGIDATVDRARREGVDLIVEGVHVVPDHEILHAWRQTGGLAVGVVMHVKDADRHRELIESREATTWRNAERYLASFDRIRAIQRRMLALAELSRWHPLDVTLEGIDDPVGYLERWFQHESMQAEMEAQQGRTKKRWKPPEERGVLPRNQRIKLDW